jgi:hypothetical protein
MSFGIISSGIFSNNGLNIIDVASAVQPLVGQVLVATSATTAEWADSSSPLTAGLGVDATQLALDIIQLETTARFAFTGNALDLNIITVPYGGTGRSTLTANAVLIGNGAAAVDISKQAPTGDFVGTTDTQSLTNKTMTDSTNDVTCTGLFSNSSANTVSVDAAANPTAGQVLTAINATSAEWQTLPVVAFSAGLGIDSAQLALDVIQLEVTARFTFSANALELNIIDPAYGGTGVGTLTLNGVLIGQGVAAVDTSKQAPTGDFVGTSDTQSLTNKTMTDSTNDVTCTGLFSNSSANTVSVDASANPTAGQVLTAINATNAEWADTVSPLTAGLGIDSTQLSFNIIQLETTARFTFSANALELNIIDPAYGGTGVSTLTLNGVLIGQGVAAVDTSKQAPTGDFVGTSDTQTLTNKTMTDSTNDVTCTGLFSNSGANTVTVDASANPTAGQVLTAINATSAEWADTVVSPLSAGLGVDAAQLALDVIQLETTARFTFSANALELSTVSVSFGGSGQTTLTNNGVLIGQGTSPIDSSKQAPTGDFVGTSDTQTLTNKTMTSNTNDVTASSFFTNFGANTVLINAATNPNFGEVLTGLSSTFVSFQQPATSNVFFALDSVGNTLATLTYQTLVYNTTVISNSHYSLVGGEVVFNVAGTYLILYAICFRNLPLAGENWIAMESVIQISTGGPFSTITGTLSSGIIRAGIVVGDFQCTTTKFRILQVTLPTTIRVMFRQVRYSLLSQTVPGQGTIGIVKLGA